MLFIKDLWQKQLHGKNIIYTQDLDQTFKKP